MGICNKTKKLFLFVQWATTAGLLKTCVRHFHLNHSPLRHTLLCTHKKMKELAEQELKILEAQHPTRFQLLKLELKAFIQLFDEEEQQQSFERKQQQQQQFHLSILTQGWIFNFILMI